MFSFEKDRYKFATLAILSGAIVSASIQNSEAFLMTFLLAGIGLLFRWMFD